MKIKDKTTTHFKDVKVGEVFKCDNGYFYMRIDAYKHYMSTINCVNLSMHDVAGLLDNEEVKIYPNATLVVDGDCDE